MATGVFGDYEDQERHHGEVEVDPLSELSTIRELTEQVAADMRESMRILTEEEGVALDKAFDLAKMVVAHRMRVLGAGYGYAV